MNLTSYHTNFHLKPPQSLFFPPKNPFQIREFRVYRRRRLKPHRRLKLTVVSHWGSSLPSSFDNLLHDFVSQFSSFSSSNFVAPAIGFASGVALYMSRFSSGGADVCDIGEWILFSSPTPFNRFVLLRCPSISFKGSELLEDVNEKLVKEDRHFVRLNSGRIQVRSGEGGRENGLEEKLEYQRTCISTEDGGVISLDWPANLDLNEEHGLDTTLLLVPGTTQGSMDKNVRRFGCEALHRGFFPVVMNPRGCAGSPLTTARLFTAADSDDICTAIQFISKARPWTTLMGVGWGYGANMLTKYLAEVGEKTPLTAATCIDNPFDLEEATRSSPYHVALDQKLTDGMIDILRSNKELFQGRAKGFDVEKALTAKSVRDFEKAISMVSYGFEAIEDFYANSSTRCVIGDVKIPVLFIQNDDGTVPLYTIPRSLIAENPFTSLLWCSCLPSRGISDGRTAISWCQHLTFEWLTAVELGLLKGRHPLLKDVDVTINPSKGLALMEGRLSNNSGKVNRPLGITQPNALYGHSIDPTKQLFESSDAAVSIRSNFMRDSQRRMELEGKGLQEMVNGALQRTSSTDVDLGKEEEVTSIDIEKGQVLQAAQVVMNMLDITMPGTLTDEEKQKVLIAVCQGETIMKALQDAVPEDVCGKLTTAISGIIHAQGTNLNFDKLLHIGKISNLSAGFESKTQERGTSSPEGLHKDPSLNQIKRGDDLADRPDTHQPGVNMPADGMASDNCSSENSRKDADLDESPSVSSRQILARRGDCESGNNHENNEFIEEKSSPDSDTIESGEEQGAKHNSSSWADKAGGNEEAVTNEGKVSQVIGVTQLEKKEMDNTQKNAEKNMDFSTDQNKMASPPAEEVARSSSSVAQPEERDGNENQKRDDRSLQPTIDQNKFITSDSNVPTFSVSQALDALTGMDDSTQAAVNNVFGVIEEMISQFEEEIVDENEPEHSNNIKEDEVKSVSERHHIVTDQILKLQKVSKNNVAVHSDTLSEPPVSKSYENVLVSKHDAGIEHIPEEPAQKSIVSNGNDTHSLGYERANYMDRENDKNKLFVDKFLTDYSDRRISSAPLYITANPYEHSLYREYFHRYLLSKMKKTKSLDLDTTTALLLDYFPEDGKWKLLEQPENIGDSMNDAAVLDRSDRHVQTHSSEEVNDLSNFIEPTYVILDSEKQQEPFGGYKSMVNMKDDVENNDDKSEKLMQYIKNIILDSLRTEVRRRLSVSGMKELESDLARDLEAVANTIALSVGHDKEHTWCLEGNNYYNGQYASEKVGTLHGERIVRAISSSVQGTNYLRSVLPVGVIVGSSLAALRKHFDVATMHDGQNQAMASNQTRDQWKKVHDNAIEKEIDNSSTIKADSNCNLDSLDGKETVETQLKSLNSDSVMVGAVTAALGASALLMQQQDPPKSQETAESLSKSLKEKGSQKESHKIEEAISDKSQNNIVTSLAEKAMSVAGPVVPTKEDGEVDQERLVAMLADLGQKGGMLRLVGKIALLWGGIRGAVSLTDKLISFLRLADRPLLHRILGFVSMVLVLWSPVVVPLLPTLVQGWTTKNPSRIAELACIIGFYLAVMILVMLWGKRIRSYDNPLEQYGLDVTSSLKIQNLLKGLVGGVMLVLLIQSINAFLGCVSFSWPSSLLPSSSDPFMWLKMYGKMLVLAGRGLITATGVVVVEELLFRSWLPEEIANDLGYHQGIIISGLAFSLFQRSPRAIPGLLLLSLALSGARRRNQGSLSIPIGLRAGIVVTSFVLQTGGFLTYKPNVPLWITGTHPSQPFSGVVGLVFALVLAITLYPRKPVVKKKLSRTIR